jgi:flagellar biosynthesis/type III secretory pathway protein FliH
MPGSLWDNFDKRMEEIAADIEAKQVPVVQEICEEILEKPIERQPAEIGIEVPASIVSFTDTPKKVVIYSDHIRYYFNN